MSKATRQLQLNRNGRSLSTFITVQPLIWPHFCLPVDCKTCRNQILPVIFAETVFLWNILAPVYVIAKDCFPFQSRNKMYITFQGKESLFSSDS